MSIQNSAIFYDHLSQDPQLKDTFYQFSTLTALCQYERLFNYVERISEKYLRVLDWGCGNGWFSYYLLQRGFVNVTSYGYGWDSIDPTQRLVPSLHYVNGESYALSNPSELPFKKDSFDLAFSIGVLEHVHETGGDQAMSMMEINRILGDGGRFFCYHLPNRFTWIEFLKGLFVADKSKHFLHTKKFGKAEIETLALEAGFRMNRIKRYNFLPNNIHRRGSLDSRFLAKLYTSLDIALMLTPLNHLAQCYMFEAMKQENV
jgi:SAM-dependent methyltransferase